MEDLRDEAFARRTDPDTSHEAAAAHTPEKLRKSQLEVLGAFEDEPRTSFVDPILVRKLWALGSTQKASGIRTRRRELQDAGLIEHVGKRRFMGTNHRMYRLKELA